MSATDTLTRDQQNVADGLVVVARLLQGVGPLPALPLVTGWTTGHVEATWQLVHDDLDEQKQLARTIIRAANAYRPGRWDKVDSGSDWFSFIRRIDGVKFAIFVTRAAVCERVVTGTRTVTEQVPDPDHDVPMVQVTREVEDFEWRCQPILEEQTASGVSA